MRLIRQLARLAVVDIRATVRSARRNAAIYATAMLFGLTAYVAFVAWIALLLAETNGTANAVLTIAVAGVVLAAILAGWALVLRRIERRRRQRRMRSTRNALALSVGLASLPAERRSTLLKTGAIAACAVLLAAALNSTDDEEDG